MTGQMHLPTQLRRAADEGATDKRPTYLAIGDHLLPYVRTSANVSEPKLRKVRKRYAVRTGRSFRTSAQPARTRTEWI